MKNLLKLAAITMMVSAISISALAASPMSAQEAEKLAGGVVPTGSVRVSTEYDDGCYEVKYNREDGQERYEVKVNASTKKVVEFDSDLLFVQGAWTTSITEEQAKQAVTGELADAQIQSAVLEWDDGFSEYQVRFKTDALYGKYTVHPETAQILEREIKIGTLSTGDIGLDKARQIAQAQFPGATLVKCKADRDDGRFTYEAELRQGRWEYEVKIDGATGTVLKTERDYDD